jgi:peptidoglycan hydrolase CwlO-like protein
MKSILCSGSIAALCAIALTSCEDPQLVEQREKQKTEISRLKGELALIDEKLKNLPPDVSADLAEAKLISTKQSEEIANLEAEIAALEGRKQALQNAYDAYRVKYQAN